MSLKGSHLVFIVCAAALAVGLGVWALRGAAGPLSATAAFLAAAVLAVYAAWIRRRLGGVGEP